MPIKVMVDTDVFSYIFNQDTRAMVFTPYLNTNPAVSFITIAQVYYGAFRKKWPSQKIERLENLLRRFIEFGYNRNISLEWAKIKSECEAEGYPIETADCWIAACARYYNYALATNNWKHFSRVKGLKLVYPGMN